MVCEENAQLADWLLFAALELRPRVARRALELLGGPGAVLDASLSDLLCLEGMTPDAAGRIQAGRSCPDLDKWMKSAGERGLRAVPYDSALYPPLLNEISDPPAVLFARGDLDALTRPTISMVGTRKATRYGQRLAEALAGELAAAGMSVVSGGAVGIDAACHTGALDRGCTIAVLGCGLDVPYPAYNQALFEKICARGLVVSEYAPGTRPEAWRFPARNRIISGLSRATIVVEAAARSGALITATFAAEQGRDVMAMPGPIDTSRSTGCHALIRDGALLVENVEQVLEALGWSWGTEHGQGESVPAAPPELPMDQGMLLLALREGQKHLDELIVECALAPAQASAAMTLLEMRGLVRRAPGNLFARI